MLKLIKSCVALFAVLSCSVSAQFISTSQILANKDFAGNSVAGWTTSGTLVFTNPVIEGTVQVGVFGRSATFSLNQRFSLNDLGYNTDLIDAGKMKFDASTWQGGWSGDNDRGRFSVRFKDENGNVIQNSTLGYRDLDVMTKSELSGFMPASTRTVEFWIDAIRNNGADLNATFAKNSLTFGADSADLKLFGGYLIDGTQVIPPVVAPVASDLMVGLYSATLNITYPGTDAKGIHYRVNGGELQTIVGTNVSQISLTGLTADTYYFVEYAGYNDLGIGDWANTSFNTSPVPVPVSSAGLFVAAFAGLFIRRRLSNVKK